MRYSVFSVQDHYPGRDRSIAELYGQVVEMAERADALGYDTFFVAEHHFHEYGVVPNPAVMLAALAQRTRRIRLGSAICILTFHDPLVVAESYAMVDVLSGGRLVYGVGSGYLKHEFAGFRVEGADKRQRFDETLMLVRRLLAGERVTHAGRFHAIDGVELNVQPLQGPHPPMFVAILAREAAYHVGKQGHHMLTVPYASVDALDDVASIDTEYRRGAREGGHDELEAVYTFHCHVAESDEACRRAAAEAFDLYVDTRLYAKKQTYEDIMRSGLGLFGSVDTVAEKLVRLHAMGVRHVSLLHNFGLMPQQTVLASMQRFAEEVMPRVRRALAKPEASGYRTRDESPLPCSSDTRARTA